MNKFEFIFGISDLRSISEVIQHDRSESNDIKKIVKSEENTLHSFLKGKKGWGVRNFLKRSTKRIELILF